MLDFDDSFHFLIAHVSRLFINCIKFVLGNVPFHVYVFGYASCNVNLPAKKKEEKRVLDEAC